MHFTIHAFTFKCIRDKYIPPLLPSSPLTETFNIYRSRLGPDNCNKAILPIYTNKNLKGHPLKAKTGTVIYGRQRT